LTTVNTETVEVIKTQEASVGDAGDADIETILAFKVTTDVSSLRFFLYR
jgi:hypothetical protein